MILDTQTFMITCLQFVFFFVNLFYFLYFLGVFCLFLLNFITKKEKQFLVYIYFSLAIIFLFSFWIVDQDLGFSFWEFFDYEFFKVFMIFDYKPSFDLVLIYYMNEFYDLFVLTLFINILFILSLKTYKVLFIIKKYKKTFYFAFLLIIFYFFFGEGFKEDLILLFFVVFILEFCFFTLYFFKNISKKIKL